MQAVYVPDLMRFVALILTALCCALFPVSVLRQGRPLVAWLAVASTEVLYFASMAAMFVHRGAPVVWYRTPFVLVSDVLMFAFIFSVWHRRP